MSDIYGVTPAGRFTHSSAPYVLPDGTIVAYNWSDLTNGNLQHAIDRTAAGLVQLPAAVWTNTNTDGTSAGSDACNNWTNGTNSAAATIGDAGEAGSGWSNTTMFPCDWVGPFYCFQQSGPGGNLPTGPLSCGYGGPCITFVTDSVHDGNLGGIAGADAICQQEAIENSLPGTYRAWISDSSGETPTSRLVHSTGPYVLVNGTVVANDWADLTDGNLQSAIERTPSGSLAPASATWTNTSDDGTTAPDNYSCNNWTSNSPSDVGNAGDVLSNLPRWSYAYMNPWSCSENLRIFCVQHP
jgi:hypothetical protein